MAESRNFGCLPTVSSAKFQSGKRTQVKFLTSRARKGSEMIGWRRFQNRSISRNHAKPFPMKPARSFFTTIGFLIYIGALPLRTSPADLPAPQIWVATWGSSQQIPEPQNELPSDDLRDATLRQIFHLSVGGSALRVHLSNAFGTADLHFTSVHIARPALQPPRRRLIQRPTSN